VERPARHAPPGGDGGRDRAVAGHRGAALGRGRRGAVGASRLDPGARPGAPGAQRGRPHQPRALGRDRRGAPDVPLPGGPRRRRRGRGRATGGAAPRGRPAVGRAVPPGGAGAAPGPLGRRGDPAAGRSALPGTPRRADATHRGGGPPRRPRHDVHRRGLAAGLRRPPARPPPVGAGGGRGRGRARADGPPHLGGDVAGWTPGVGRDLRRRVVAARSRLRRPAGMLGGPAPRPRKMGV
ncbi:MAG: Maleylpyruvate isomerase, mycothiol-dependent, partial [uncultured Nocardioidaceae bacterium]